LKIIFKLLFISFFVFLFSSSVIADDNTNIIISPNTQTISPGEIFSFNVTCNSSVPMKSFELKISFNPSIIQINSVSEGTLFAGYNTFFNEGEISNNNGKILDVFNLILGSGNVSTNGSCITVSGVAGSSTGQSSIHLYDVGVTDETGYLQISTIDGSIIVQHDIDISNPIPSDLSSNIDIDSSSLSVDISHESGGFFNYSIVTSPDIGSVSAVNQSNATMSCSIDGLYYDTTYSWTVSVQEIQSGNWTNRSFSFSTESEPGGGDNGNPGGGGGGGGGPPPIEEPDPNNPPVTPLKPSGPLFIEPGVSYSFESMSYDNDGDQIRYRYNWGDGNLSDWSTFLSSNETITMIHQWLDISNFTITVIAQDELGLNSSWSESVIVTCMATESDDPGSAPIANFTLTNMAIDNTSSIQFNASSSFDIDDDIVFYEWDFGDGTTATGINPDHEFLEPGVYEVTLVVTDSKGNSYSKTLTVTVSSNVESSGLEQSKQNTGFSFMFFSIFVGIVFLVIALFLLIKKDIIYYIIKKESNINKEKSFFDDFSIGETFLDGVKKAKELTENLYTPFVKGSSNIFHKPFGFQNKTDINAPLKIYDDELNNMDNVLEDIVPLKESDHSIIDPLDQESMNLDSKKDKVNNFFNKYSIDKVRRRVDFIFGNSRKNFSDDDIGNDED